MTILCNVAGFKCERLDTVLTGLPLFSVYSQTTNNHLIGCAVVSFSQRTTPAVFATCD